MKRKLQIRYFHPDFPLFMSKIIVQIALLDLLKRWERSIRLCHSFALKKQAIHNKNQRANSQPCINYWSAPAPGLPILVYSTVLYRRLRGFGPAVHQLCISCKGKKFQNNLIYMIIFKLRFPYYVSKILYCKTFLGH